MQADTGSVARHRVMSKTFRNAAGLTILFAVTVAIAIADDVFGKNFDPWIAYVIPISLAASIAGLGGGVSFSILSAGLLLYVGRAFGNPFPNPLCFYFQVGSDLVAFLFIACLVSVLRGHRTKDRHAGETNLATQHA